MEIDLPVEAKHLVGKVPEEKLILIGFFHLLMKRYANSKWFTVYRYDLYAIIGLVKTGCSPEFVFRGLETVFRAANTSDYTTDVSFKRWSGDEFEYTVERYRNVIVWCHIMDQRTYLEQPEDVLPLRYQVQCQPGMQWINRAIKLYDKTYNR